MLLTSHQVFGHCSKLPKYLLLSRIFLLYSIKSYHHFSFIAEFLNIANFFRTFFVESKDNNPSPPTSFSSPFNSTSLDANFKCISEPLLKSLISSYESIKYSPSFFFFFFFLTKIVCIYVHERERERERERRFEAQVVNTYKLKPSESKFVIGVKEKSNGSLYKYIYIYTKSIY